MAGVIRLRHAHRAGDWRMYFYEGEAAVKNGIITLPLNRPEWIRRAWVGGFRLTPEGRVIADIEQYVRVAKRDAKVPTFEKNGIKHKAVDPNFIHIDDEECLCLAPAVDLKTAQARIAKSDEETTDDEGPDAGGQPAGEDRVRSSEPEGDEGVSGSRDGVRDGGEPAAAGDADRTASAPVRSRAKRRNGPSEVAGSD